MTQRSVCARDLVATKHHSFPSQAEAEPDSAYWKANSEKAKTLKAATATGSFTQTYSWTTESLADSFHWGIRNALG